MMVLWENSFGKPTCDLVMQGSAYGFNTTNPGGSGVLQSVWEKDDIALGDEHPTRTIVAVTCITGQSVDVPGAGAFDSAALDGVDMDEIVNQYRASGGVYVQTVITSLRKPSGATGDFIWNSSIPLNNNSSGFTAIYNCKFLRSGFHTNTAVMTPGAGDFNKVSLNVPRSSIILAGVMVRANITGAVWGAAAPNADIDADGPPPVPPATFPGKTGGNSALIAHRVAPTPSATYLIQNNNTLDNQLVTLAACALFN